MLHVLSTWHSRYSSKSQGNAIVKAQVIRVKDLHISLQLTNIEVNATIATRTVAAKDDYFFAGEILVIPRTSAATLSTVTYGPFEA